MRLVLRCHCLIALPVFALITAARADDELEPPRGHSREVVRALEPLIEQYGVDAINLQGNLLRHAIAAESVLEASSVIAGFERTDGVRYLVFRIQTGIAYKDPDVPPPARPVRIWQDVIEPSLRPCKRLQLPAEGIQLEVSYWHANFANRSDLARAVREGTALPEVVSFRIKARDILDFAHDRVTAPDLAERSAIELDGTRLRLQIPPAQPTKTG